MGEELIGIGTVWESRDRRDRGKLVIVTDHFDRRVIVKTISHPSKAHTVGWSRILKVNTLREKYRFAESGSVEAVDGVVGHVVDLMAVLKKSLNPPVESVQGS